MKQFCLVVLCLVLLGSTLPGCQGAAKKPQTPQQNTPQGNLDVSASDRRVMAAQLSKTAESVPDVQKATVVVSEAGSLPASGNTKTLVAMVGLTVSSSLSNDANKVNTIKQTVADKVKASDTRINQVLVTTDPTMIKRINDIAAGIIEGKPIQSFEKDINTLTNDLKQQK
ncbi:MAG: YhcN/YlaJ family sporulation lipoprotein [Syntrophomonadaceae bacterium]